MRKLILPAYQNKDAYDLFLCAVREMESASLYRKKKQYLELKNAIQRSANCFARALLVAKGKASSNDEITDALMSSELKILSDNNNPIYKIILDVISLETEDDIYDQPNIKTQGIYNRYRDALVSGRKILAHDLNYNENPWKIIQYLLFTRTGFKRSSYILLPLLILIALPFAVYHHLEPVHNSNLVGQIFWKPKGDIPFNVQLSHSFPVREGKHFHEYSIPLPDPVDIHLLRVDPIHHKYFAEIEIEWIRLINKEGILLLELTSKDFKKWLCTNCVELPVGENNIFRIQVTRKDPYVTSTLIDQEKVKLMTIRMRIISKKTFWEWVLGIDT